MAESSNSVPSNQDDVLLLFNDPTAFKSEMYLSVTSNVPKAKNVALTGTFVSKVFEGKYNSIPKFLKQMDAYLSRQNKKAKDFFVHYAYCPKCAKKTDHNYMVIFAEV